MPENILIGSVPYLNGKPLTRWFKTPEGQKSGVTVIEDTPSQLALMLERGEIAAALVSSFESFRRPELVWVPDISIGGQDEIRTVCAFSPLPYNMIQSIAMDTSSLTSVALLTILLSEIYNAHPQHLSLPPDLKTMLSRADAALLIGDPCMRADRRELNVLDLGASWRKHTGLPFVYALWIGRPENITPQITDALLTAKAYGLANIEEIAAEESQRLGRSFEECREYVTRIMDYNLDGNMLRGLETFREKAFANNLLGQSRGGGSSEERISE